MDATRAEPHSEQDNGLRHRAWTEFVFGGHLLALGDAMVACALALVLGIHITWVLPLVVYLAVLAINSFNRFQEFEQDVLTNPERSVTMGKYMRLFPILIGGMLVVMALLVLLTAPLPATGLVVVMVVLGLLYTTLLKGLTRKVVGFKNFAIAVPYALIMLLLPMYYREPITMATFLVLSFYYGRIFLSAVFFDIKDTQSDAEEGLKTFAAVLGKDKTATLCIYVNVLSLLPLVYGVLTGLLPTFSLALLLTAPYAMYYLVKVRDSDTNYAFLFNVVADGEFVFWLGYVALAKYLL